MSDEEQRAVVHLSLLAAFADGDKHERERDEVQRIADGLAGQVGGLHLSTLTQDVLLKRVSIADVAGALVDRGSRQLAYEMAVCVCDADGLRSDAERRFLDQVRGALGLDAQAVAPIESQADAMASTPLATGPMAEPPPVRQPHAEPGMLRVDDAALDKKILDAAILNGALELLPESLSTLAIIPLQMKLVYAIGKSHGYELDSGHVKDFLATLGVGLTSQYLEQAGRKLLGGVLGALGGGLAGGLLRGAGRQAVSSGMSFVSTYALGQVARRYYAGGRVMSQAVLRQAYEDMSAHAAELRTRHLPQMQEQARTLDAQRVLALVRGR